MTDLKEKSAEKPQPETARYYPALLLLAALIAVLPLIIKGASCGHDFDFHIQNWMEVASQWHHGILLPRWAFTAAWNAGEPRLLFYPPISWHIGALLGLILPWAWTPAVFTWVALTLSGLTLYRLARHWCSPVVSFTAACVYLANPYMLFTAYERTAYAELLAAAWMPLLLASLLRKQISIGRIAIAVALLWLTNAPAAVVGCYSIVILGLIRIAQQRFDRTPTRSTLLDVLRITAGTALGLGLAAFYVLPAAFERRFVQITMALLPGMHPWESFLFTHTGDTGHDGVLHTASIASISLIALALIAAVIKLSRPVSSLANKEENSVIEGRSVTIIASTLIIAILLLLTPLSTSIWKHAPELPFLQFPWRFVSIAGAAATLLLALALQSFSSNQQRRTLLTTVGVLITIVLTSLANRTYRQLCYPEDTVSARSELFQQHGGTEPTDEYTPTDADNDALQPNNPNLWLGEDEDAQPPVQTATTNQPAEATFNGIVEIHTSRPDHIEYSIRDPQSRYLILNQRAFYGWQTRVNGIEQPTVSHRDDGLLAIALPANGSTLVDIEYRTTKDQQLGSLITVIAAIIFFLALATRRRDLIGSIPKAD